MVRIPEGIVNDWSFVDWANVPSYTFVMFSGRTTVVSWVFAKAWLPNNTKDSGKLISAREDSENALSSKARIPSGTITFWRVVWANAPSPTPKQPSAIVYSVAVAFRGYAKRIFPSAEYKTPFMAWQAVLPVSTSKAVTPTFEKAAFPISVTPTGILTDESITSLRKAYCPIVLRLAGRLISVSFAHSRKAPSFSVSTPSPNVTLDKFGQSWKALLPIVLQLPGIVISAIPAL